MARQVADVYLGPKLGPEEAPPNPVRSDQTPVATAVNEQVHSTDFPGEYPGEYRSAELKTIYRIEARGSQLRLGRRNLPELLLSPSGPETFRARFVTIRFTRESGRVNGFMLDAGRVRNIRFDSVVQSSLR